MLDIVSVGNYIKNNCIRFFLPMCIIGFKSMIVEIVIEVRGRMITDMELQFYLAYMLTFSAEKIQKKGGISSE